MGQSGSCQSCITVLSNPAFLLSFPYVSSLRLLPKRPPAGSSWPLRLLPGTPLARGSHLGMRHLHVFTLNPLAFFITNFYFQATEKTRLKAGTLIFLQKFSCKPSYFFATLVVFISSLLSLNYELLERNNYVIYIFVSPII